MIREIVFTPAWDKRDPNPSKNYGIHGVEMRWYLKGLKGVIQFVVHTNWQLPHVREQWDSMVKAMFLQPIPADLGYHSPRPLYKGQEPISSSCHLLPGPCYYDGSSLRAEELFEILVEHGSEAVWKFMEEEYKLHFKETKAS